jgi:hypothetical protein
MLGRLQAMAEENGDRALESSIVTAQRAVACWQELSQRVANHEHARDLASSLERQARERLHLILDLVTRFADLPSTPGRRLDAAGLGPDPAPPPGLSGGAGTGARSGGPGAAPEIAVHLLGGFELRVDGRRVDQWRGRRGQALLQFLVAHRRRAVSREALIEALWPEADENAGRRATSSSPTGWPTCTRNGATMRPPSRPATGRSPATPGTRSARAARCVHVGGEHRDVDVLAGSEDETDLAAAVLGAEGDAQLVLATALARPQGAGRDLELELVGQALARVQLLPIAVLVVRSPAAGLEGHPTPIWVLHR